MKTSTTQMKRDRIKRKVRARISGTAARPRLSIFRSNNYMYAQLIDDTTGRTLAAATDRQAKKITKMQGAVLVGTDIAARAKEAKITAVVFDRNGFKYAGRVQAVADAARKAGLEF